MGPAGNTFRKLFWPVFIVVFITIAIFVAGILFQPVKEIVERAILGDSDADFGTEGALPAPDTGPSGDAAGSGAGPAEVPRIENAERYGVIMSDEVWAGTVRVTGDIAVLEPATLTIEPGTNVRVSAGSDASNLSTAADDLRSGIAETQREDLGVHIGEPFNDEANHVSIFIYGTLNAVGTPEEMITITSDAENPDRYNWNFFQYHHGILSYAVVEYYRGLGPKNDAVLSHSILRHAGACGVCITGSDGVVVEFNEIYDAGHELVDTHQSRATIRNNIIGPNPVFSNPSGHRAGGGCIIIDGGAPRIENNTITGCDDGVAIISAPDDSSLPDRLLEDNDFSGNVEDVALHYLG